MNVGGNHPSGGLAASAAEVLRRPANPARNRSPWHEGSEVCERYGENRRRDLEKWISLFV